MNAPKHRRYRERYPRFGKLAILCEGDVAGFEVDMIEKWTSSQGYVDVWPCGTKTALYGVSDAIGRAVPTIAIEDRDYRSPKEAQKECKAKASDRRRRAVNLVQWSAWRRHEIENYVIEPDILLPVLSEVFQQDQDIVRDRLGRVIECSRTDQVAQYVLAQLSSQLPGRAEPKFIPGLPRTSARPSWNADRHEFESPSVDVVLVALRKEVESVLKRFRAKLDGVTIDGTVEEFHRKREEWTEVTVESNEWRYDWAGKEILTRIVRWLSGEFGWPASHDAELQPIAWGELKRGEADARDREMIEDLQPRLVKSFLGFLDNQDSAHEIREEWDELRVAVADAVQVKSNGDGA